MATEPLGEPAESPVEALQAERDALAARCAETEALLDEAMAELAAAQQRIAELEEAAAEEGRISLFSGGSDLRAGGLARDGSDPRVLSVLLAATAVVAGLVALLAFLNGNLGTPFGFAMVAAALGLAWGAAHTRVQTVDVSVSNGVVYIEQGESKHRFDLRNEGTRLEVQGSPGDSYWQVSFHRRGLDPFVVDADMVDAEEFMRQVREWRPEL